MLELEYEIIIHWYYTSNPYVRNTDTKWLLQSISSHSAVYAPMHFPDVYELTEYILIWTSELSNIWYKKKI